MKKKKKLQLLSEIIECDVALLSPEKDLSDLEEWDSLSALSYIMYMMEHYGIKKSGSEIRNFKKVQDILDTLN